MFGTVFGKSLRDQRRGFIGWSVGVVATVAVMAAIWPSFSDVDISSLVQQYPEAMQRLFDLDSFASAAGYLNVELYSMVLPAVFIIYAVGRGARLTAGDETDGTLELVVTMPIGRSRILLEKAAALAVVTAALAVVLWASSVIVSATLDLGVPVRDLTFGAVAMFLIGVEFGLLAFAAGAVTGNRAVALGTGGVAAVAAYLLYVIGKIEDSVEPFLVLSPFEQALRGGPVGPGLALVALWMPLVGIVALAVAVPVFHRRDLHG